MDKIVEDKINELEKRVFYINKKHNVFSEDIKTVNSKIDKTESNTNINILDTKKNADDIQINNENIKKNGDDILNLNSKISGINVKVGDLEESINNISVCECLSEEKKRKAELIRNYQKYRRYFENNSYVKQTIETGACGGGATDKIRIYFICNPNSIVRIKAKVAYKFLNNNGYDQNNISVLVDGISNIGQTISGTDIEGETVHTYMFYSEKQSHYLEFYTRTGNSTYNDSYNFIKKIEIEIWASGVEIISRDENFKAIILGGKIYLTKHIEGKHYYLTQATDNVNLNAEYKLFSETLISDSSKRYYGLWNIQNCPAILANNATQKYYVPDNMDQKFIGRFLYIGTESIFGEFTIINGQYFATDRLIIISPYMISYTNPKGNSSLDNCYYSFIGRAVSAFPGLEMYPVVLFGSYMEGLVNPVRLSGKMFPTSFIDIKPSFSINWENFNQNEYYIIQDNLGRNYFLPGENVDYCIELGFGCQVNCYSYGDEVIVYMRNGNNTIKRKLIINESTSKFELSSDIEIIENCLEIIEGTNGEKLYNRMGEWEFVPT